jgi:hypothetical protein
LKNKQKIPTLFVIRGRAFDKLARTLADQLSQAGLDVLLVMDERQEETDTSPYDKLSIDETALAAIGITGLPKNWAWFCGDLCYYLAATKRPEYARYCLVESDVYIAQAGLGSFINAVTETQFDAVASQLGPQTKRRIYSRDLAQLELDPNWGCIFPITAVSRAVLLEMKDLRSEVLTDHPNAHLNDEAILSGALQRGGFRYTSLEKLLPKQFSRDCFDTNPPHLHEGIAQDGAEIRIFHPVATFDTVLHRIGTGEKNYNKHRLRKILRAAPPTFKTALLAHLAKH